MFSHQNVWIFVILQVQGYYLWTYCLLMVSKKVSIVSYKYLDIFFLYHFESFCSQFKPFTCNYGSSKPEFCKYNIDSIQGFIYSGVCRLAIHNFFFMGFINKCDCNCNRFWTNQWTTYKILLYLGMLKLFFH